MFSAHVCWDCFVSLSACDCVANLSARVCTGAMVDVCLLLGERGFLCSVVSAEPAEARRKLLSPPPAREDLLQSRAPLAKRSWEHSSSHLHGPHVQSRVYAKTPDQFLHLFKMNVYCIKWNSGWWFLHYGFSFLGCCSICLLSVVVYTCCLSDVATVTFKLINGPDLCRTVVVPSKFTHL